jgi:hypothetical protein
MAAIGPPEREGEKMNRRNATAPEIKAENKRVQTIAGDPQMLATAKQILHTATALVATLEGRNETGEHWYVGRQIATLVHDASDLDAIATDAGISELTLIS